MEQEIIDCLDPLERCETVKIVAGDSYAIINKEDFDEKTMKLFGEKAKKAEKE